jgi:hypothetical protein
VLNNDGGGNDISLGDVAAADPGEQECVHDKAFTRAQQKAPKSFQSHPRLACIVAKHRHGPCSHNDLERIRLLGWFKGIKMFAEVPHAPHAWQFPCIARLQ